MTGAPFRVGFYAAVDYNVQLGCTTVPISATVDIDGWNLTIWSCPPPAFVSQPVDAAACVGASASLSANAPTASALQWRRNGVSLVDVAGRISGSQSGVLMLSQITAADAGVYDCIASGPCNAPINITRRASSPATLAVCPADFNCSGSISVQDIFDFLAAYFSGAANADFNASGVISVQDIFDFLAAYFAGCN